MAVNVRPPLALNFNSMPADFEKCVAEGGKVITKRVNADEYKHLCKDKAGHWHDGETKKYKKLSRSKK